jgi:predicted phosphodiesterase
MAEIEALKEEAKRKVKRFKKVRRQRKGESGYMLEMSIEDLHAGKLAWGKETGYEDFDLPIAERIFGQAVNALLDRTRSYPLDEICFVVGNDLLNSDNAEGTTTLGTHVSNDSRYQKVFRTTRLMLTRTIEYLLKIAPVRVIVVPGNHDHMSAWHMGDSLECYFHKCPDVVVDNAPTERKYYQFGSVMLMWTHGDKGRRGDYPLLMATEKPKMFGSTKFREIHTGHLHQVRLEETHGIRVRILPSLTAVDTWLSGKGFTSQMRSAEAYVWSKEEGLVGMATYTLPSGGRE